MTDNFNLINSLLRFVPGEFYFVQIIQRKKEIPELGSNNRTIQTYYIETQENFDRRKEEIISICNMFNARAYIHLNRRSWQKVSIEFLGYLSEIMKSNQFDVMKGGLNTVIGRMKTQDRLWIVDMDDCHLSDTFPVIEHINTLQPLNVVNKCKAIIPTKNGYHLITTAFNSQEFSKRYPDIDIHKNNPSILYIP